MHGDAPTSADDGPLEKLSQARARERDLTKLRGDHRSGEGAHGTWPRQFAVLRQTRT